MADIICSFCGAPEPQVKSLIKGINAYICDDCVGQCQGVLDTEKTAKARKTGSGIKSDLTPVAIVRHLDQYVVGQDRAKKLLAVAVYNHYKRVGKKLDVEVQKSNVLLVGPTGCGKTLLVQTLAKLFDVPFAQADATTFTEAGYVGDDVEMILGKLALAAGGDIEKAERGIVYLDECDKIARSDTNGKDVRGEGVQQALLKMMEGTTVTIDPKGGKKGPTTSTQEIDTTNILFIMGGAFSGLTDKATAKKPVGFHDLKTETKKLVSHKDIIRYGMIPEFVGRLPVIAELEHLTEEDLVRILVDPKNSITRQYQALMALDDCQLEFDASFLKAVAARSAREGTGARGLRSILEQALTDSMYQIPGKKVKHLKVTEELLDNDPIKPAKERLGLA